MKTQRELSEFQKRMLDLMEHGCALSAARHNYKAQELRDMEDLVTRGLARRQSPAPWNKAGAFVKNETRN